MQAIRLETAQDTQEYAYKLGKEARAGQIYILDGPLGAGKTTFTQGFARGLGVKGRISSPTFVIAREHKSLIGGPDLIHVDAYRLLDGVGSTDDALDALESLGLDVDLDHVVIVAEWGGNFMEYLGEDIIKISFDRETALADDPESTARIIHIEG